MPFLSRVRPLLVPVVVLLLAGPAGWVATDVLERDNDFCNACHIEGDVPLHIDIRHDLDTRPPRSLAALHGERVPAWRPADPHLRCFDCHSGTGLVGRARIKLVAARDLGVWLAGRAEEPTHLTVPIVDPDCTKCHPDPWDRAGAGRSRPPFHSLSVHARDLGADCVTCHPVHDADVDPGFHFMNVARVRTECARCHNDFGNGSTEY